MQGVGGNSIEKYNRPRQTRQCPEPKLAETERKCYDCGEFGHVKNECQRSSHHVEEIRCYGCGMRAKLLKVFGKWIQEVRDSPSLPSVVEKRHIISSKLNIMQRKNGDLRPYIKVSIVNKEYMGLMNTGAKQNVHAH